MKDSWFEKEARLSGDSRHLGALWEGVVRGKVVDGL